MAARIAQWEMGQQDFIEVITDKSDGNFMYLVHVMNDIRDDRLTGENIDSIHDLPQGLEQYYRKHWALMREPDPVRFDSFHLPVVATLAAAREPATIAQVVEWTRKDWPHLDATAIVDVIREWREFLNEDKRPGKPPAYRVYHASFQDFLMEEVGLRQFHSRIAQGALDKIPGWPSSTGG